MKLLITGTGRSGTTWMSQALCAAGVDAAHEWAYSLFRRPERARDVEVSWLAAPFTPLSGVYTVHLVRHPLDVIRSRASGRMLADLSSHYGSWALKHAPEIGQWSTTVERCAQQWVSWNLMVRGSDELIRLEDVDVVTVNRLAHIVDRNAPGVRELPPPANVRPERISYLAWSDVEHIPGLIELAHQYGYLPETTIPDRRAA